MNSCSTFRGCTTPKSGYRSIDVQILRLRRKIETNPSRPEYIKAERAVGYVFDTPSALVLFLPPQILTDRRPKPRSLPLDERLSPRTAT